GRSRTRAGPGAPGRGVLCAHGNTDPHRRLDPGAARPPDRDDPLPGGPGGSGQCRPPLRSRPGLDRARSCRQDTQLRDPGRRRGLRGRPSSGRRRRRRTRAPRHPGAARLARELSPDLAILDLSMPLLNGIETGRTMMKSCPSVRTIALTIHTESHYVLAALEAGFSGYVLKSQAAAQLVRAIREVGRGSIYLSPGVSRVVVEASLNREKLPSDPLTGRERE